MPFDSLIFLTGALLLVVSVPRDDLEEKLVAELNCLELSNLGTAQASFAVGRSKNGPFYSN